MRRAGLIGLASLLLAAACGPLGARTFQLEFPGRELVDPLTIVVDDRAGIVVGIAPWPLGGQEGVSGVADRPNELVLSWLGGMCDQRTRFTVEAAPNGYTITGRTQRAAGCRQAGIFRGIALDLSRPVPPERVILIAPEG